MPNRQANPGLLWVVAWDFCKHSTIREILDRLSIWLTYVSWQFGGIYSNFKCYNFTTNVTLSSSRRWVNLCIVVADALCPIPLGVSPRCVLGIMTPKLWGLWHAFIIPGESKNRECFIFVTLIFADPKNIHVILWRNLCQKLVDVSASLIRRRHQISNINYVADRSCTPSNIFLRNDMMPIVIFLQHLEAKYKRLSSYHCTRKMMFSMRLVCAMTSGN